MSGRRVRQVLFCAYPQDHIPRHIHAFVGKAKKAHEVIIDLNIDGTVTLAKRHDAVRGATNSEVKKVLAAAADSFDELVMKWEDMHKCATVIELKQRTPKLTKRSQKDAKP